MGMAGRTPARRSGTGDPHRGRGDATAAAQRGRRRGTAARRRRVAGLAGADGRAARRPARPRGAGRLGPGTRTHRRYWDWLAVEAAAAALQDKGPDEALSRVWESMPGTDLDTCLAEVRATGHPDAAELSQAVAEFAASGTPRSIDQVAELKVSLPGSRPPIWRRVRLPVTATLGDLHNVIQVLFGWDGDHLHVFQAGKKRYSDPLMDLD